MKKILKLIFTFMLGITISLVSVNCIYAEQGKAPEQVTILGGTTGGDWFQIGAIFSEMFRKQGVQASLEIGGGTSNVSHVNMGNAELGFSMTPSIARALKGGAPYDEKHEDVMALALMYKQIVTMIVTEDSGITSLEQLKGKRFASQPIGSSNQVICEEVLQAYGLTEDDLILSRGGLAEQKTLIQDRHVDGMANSFLDMSHIEEINMTVPIRVLPIPDEKFEELLTISNAYAKAEVVWKGETIPTATAFTYLMVNRNVPEDEVYWMTKIILDNIQELKDFRVMFEGIDAEFMSQEIGLKLHPGARKAYEDAGVVFVD